MERKQWFPLVTVQLAILLVALTVFSISLRVISAANEARSANSEMVAAPKVDYARVKTMIEQEIATLPAPKDGTEGRPGEPATVDYDKVDSLIQERLAALPKPPNGNDGLDGLPGEPAPVPEFRYNSASGDLEWRYVGDDSWQLLLETCILTDTCND